MFQVVKYTFSICDPDWTFTNSIEWDEIKNLLVVGKHEDYKFSKMFKSLKNIAYGDDNTMLIFINRWLAANKLNCLTDDFIEKKDTA